MRWLVVFAVTLLLASPSLARVSSPVSESPRSSAVRVSPQQREADIKSILSRREFRGAEKSVIEKEWEWLKGELIRLLGSIFGDGFLGSADTKTASTALAVIVLVLFILLLAYVLARIGSGRLGTRLAMDGPDEDAGPETSAKALDEAAASASAGDFRTALRLVYLAVLLRLDEREVIRFDRAGTNWEYLSALKARPELHAALRPVTLTFDRKWYGHEAASESDYESFVAAYHSVDSTEVGE